MPRLYKRKTEVYEFENLKRAVEDVRNKRFSIAQASKMYSVPRSTIHGRINQEIITEPRRGKKHTFTKELENKLEEHCINCSQLFNVLTADVIRKIAFEFAKAYKVRNNFDKISKMAGKDWYYGFMKRHPNIIVVPNKKLEISEDGAKVFNEAEVLQYSDYLIAQEIIHHVDKSESQSNEDNKGLANKKKRKIDETYRRNTVSRGDVDTTHGDMMTEESTDMASELYENDKNKSTLNNLQIQVLKQLIRKRPYSRTKERKGERFRSAESEPEVALTAEVVEISDPLEALSIPGPSRNNLRSYDNTATDRDVYFKDEIPLSSSARNIPYIQQLSTLSLDLDIKEEIVHDSTRTGEETLADFGIVSEENVSESDISSNDVILNRRFKAESNSDSQVYFKAQSVEKPKQKVTTELLFHRYKLKSKREIDRLHKKIRELKASVLKYKRRVYKLQRRCDNLTSEN